MLGSRCRPGTWPPSLCDNPRSDPRSNKLTEEQLWILWCDWTDKVLSQKNTNILELGKKQDMPCGNAVLRQVFGSQAVCYKGPLSKHSTTLYHLLFFIIIIIIIITDLRERKGEREISIWCYTYLCTHWLSLVCALTRDQTCNIGVSGQYKQPGTTSSLCRNSLRPLNDWGIFQLWDVEQGIPFL